MIEFIDITELTVPLKPVRSPPSGLPGFVPDIESHLPAGHPYRDADTITWVHEGTHGINSRIRNEIAGPRQNGIYLLGDAAVTLHEPDTTISKVAQLVPSDLRGQVYRLYLIDQQSGWNDVPLYMLDEWSGYLNGSRQRAAIESWNQRQETVQYCLEFVVYAWAMIEAAGFPPNLRRFMKWQTQSAMLAYGENQGLTGATDWKLKMESHDYWTRFEEYCGRIWVDRYLRGRSTI